MRLHEPDEKTRNEVKSLTSFGVTQEEISSYLGIDPKTLRKHYADEISNSQLRANAAVARVLFEKATKERDNACIFFWLKTRAKWRETANKDEESSKEEALLNLLQLALKEKANGDKSG